MKLIPLQEKIKLFEKKQIIVSFLLLLIFAGGAIVANTLHIESVAEQSMKYISRLEQLNYSREVTLILEETRLQNFISIRYQSSTPGKSFTLPPSEELKKSKSLWKFLSTDRVTFKTEDALSFSESDILTFEYNRFALVPYAFLFWILLNLFSIPQTRLMKRKLVEQFTKDLESKKALIKADIARHVRHNIRTPVASLMRIPGKLPQSASEERKTLLSIISQINSLVATLDEKQNLPMTPVESNSIYETLIQSRIELKNACPKHINFDFQIDDMISSMKVKHIPHELRAVLGNLFNNSIEAIQAEGTISIIAKDNASELEIFVLDSGQGIPQEIQDMVFENSFSHGKASGSGIGLYHAKTWVQKWRGDISIEKTDSTGTTFKISIPLYEREDWYVPRLKFNANSKLIILDDQAIMREAWGFKLQQYPSLTKIEYYGKATDVSQALNAKIDNVTLLFDNDLGRGLPTGLEILKGASASFNRFLVTANFDQPEIQSECLKSGIKLIPKSQIGDLPIVVV